MNRLVEINSVPVTCKNLSLNGYKFYQVVILPLIDDKRITIIPHTDIGISLLDFLSEVLQNFDKSSNVIFKYAITNGNICQTQFESIYLPSVRWVHEYSSSNQYLWTNVIFTCRDHNNIERNLEKEISTKIRQIERQKQTAFLSLVIQHPKVDKF